MKISTRLKLIASFSFIIVLIITISLSYVTFVEDRLGRENTVMLQLFTGVTEMEILTSDYLLFQETRVEIQWRQKHASLMKGLPVIDHEYIVKQDLLKKIRHSIISIGETFDELSKLHDQADPDNIKKNRLILELRQRFRSHILLEAREISSNSFKLVNLIQDELKRMERRERYLIMFLSFTLLAGVTFITFTLRKSILDPIEILQKGMEVIGQGDLNFKFGSVKKNEIGNLSRAFDMMTSNLQQVTASRNDLKKEIKIRRKAEAELIAKQIILDESQKLTHLGSWELELVTNKLYLSDEVFRIFRLDPKNFSDTYEDFLKLVHPEDREQVEKAYNKSCRDRGLYDLIHRIVRPDGSIRFIQNQCIHYFDNMGTVFRSVGSFHDITDRIRAEKSLKESHETFLTVLDSIDASVYVADLETYEILFMNKHMKDSFGADFTGNICWEAFQHEFAPCSYCTNDKLLDEEGNPTGVQVWNDQHPVTGRWHINYDRAIKWMDGRYVRLQAATDITDFKKMEEQLRQAQKMEAIGVLAGGVAHDFNNILTTIIGNASLALMTVDKDDTLQEEIEEIKAAGERAAALTRQLLAFSRKQIIHPKILDLNELLGVIEKMLGRLIGEDVEVLIIPESELWQVEIDPGQMEQVIMNLVINARDAMPNGGKLTIKTFNMDLGENYFREHGIEEQPGSYVVMAVSDTGSGMDKETQEHIFEPFYTTKEKGKGTGLGLSTVYGIVKQNNGFIWVYSEPEQGSTFKVYLPKVVRDAESEKKGITTAVDLSGSETVLLVEDDESLRKLAQTALQKKGYKILEAKNGEDALRVSEAHDGPIDLLLTDVVMPKMSGKETAERVQPLYPQMKVIYMSGYTDDALLHHGVLAPGLNFLEKPFTPEGLARKVREVLDK